MQTILLEAVRQIGAGLERPEGVAVDSAGVAWAADGRGCCSATPPSGATRLLGSLGGVPNGICLDGEGNVIVANIGNGQLQRLHPDGRHEVLLADEKAPTPNFPVVDSRGNIYCSNSTLLPIEESFRRRANDGAVFRLTPDGRLDWLAEGLFFANGLALSPDESTLYVAQTSARNVLRIPLHRDGTAGVAERYGPELGPRDFPDGVALDAAGNLYVTLPFRNAIGVITADGAWEIVLDDPAGQALHRPANITFAGPDLRDAYLGNLDGQSIPVFRVETPGIPLIHQR